ncbi:MAG: hypothetical protein HZB42_03950 [Sphingobacteriales bacterium]|nr:hypothetical protein [Sphingobacteriales bacterium]
MKKTTSKVLDAIRDGDINKFKNLIGVELEVIGKDEEFVQTDLDEFHLYYNRYIKVMKPNVLLTNEIDHLGSRKVIIQMYKGSDIENNIAEIILELFFGPPNMVPLNKISDYGLVVKTIKERGISLPPNMRPNRQ